MATLDFLQSALEQKAGGIKSFPKDLLSDLQYSGGFESLLQGPGWRTYQDFIIPELSQLLAHLSSSGNHISVLEIGPGSKSLLGYLPYHLRQNIGRYVAFEPNSLFAIQMEEWLCPALKTESPLPGLKSLPDIRQTSFVLNNAAGSSESIDTNEKFDLVLLCHSMYGMNAKEAFIKQALEMLVERPESGMVVVFHCDRPLHYGELASYQTASFPTGVVSVVDDDEELDKFASVVAGYVMDDVNVKIEWRKVCRALARQEEAYPNHLTFSCPSVMVTFTRYAIILSELKAKVPLANGNLTVKSRQARLHRPAAIARPTEVKHIQLCLQWALKHSIGLTVIGGGHSDHCLWPNAVAVDMRAFNEVHIVTTEQDVEEPGYTPGSLVVAGAGCKTEDIIRKTMAAGLTVPLGSGPNVGAGSWLQGGIGHLARLYGLTCDSIVGAVMVSVNSSQIFCIGQVPSQHRPADAVRPKNESDLLWALKGAGTNIGIIVSVSFKAFTARAYQTLKGALPMPSSRTAKHCLSHFASQLGRQANRRVSTDMYLYCENGELRLGMAHFRAFSEPPTPDPDLIFPGMEDFYTTVDGVGPFDTDFYVAGKHGGHRNGKTSSFKRCIFLKDIGEWNITSTLVTAIETRPTELSYLHLLQGGGAVRDIAADATAFGCRDWNFACVIAGVWPRDQDGTEIVQTVEQWVYKVVEDLLPLSSGVYGADLGPDPRDAELALKAFGPNGLPLACLKRSMDPRNILAYTCPMPKMPKQKLIVLVTGDVCAGKDYTAQNWVTFFNTYPHANLKARTVSISDDTKREYAAAGGADLSRLYRDRAYKEQHRQALTLFFQKQVRDRPWLTVGHFRKVYNAANVDVLLITGVRDEAPVARFSHLVPDSRVIEVHIKASEETRRARLGCPSSESDGDDKVNIKSDMSNKTAMTYCPTYIFDNDAPGIQASKRFAEKYLLPFFHEDLQRLADMVRRVLNSPFLWIDSQHVLNISQQPGGLALCTSLLQSHFAGDWNKINAIACCESGGFIYASPLASQVGVPLALIREVGKLPPPTNVSVGSTSYISGMAHNDAKVKAIEMEQGLVPRGASVVVVDDVLATGERLCAVLQLLDEAGANAEDVSIMVVAEFPVHRGRDLLRRRGFDRANIQSLLVLPGR